MPNRLAGGKSPYLLQHAENPVDWYPWGEEAFLKAKLEDKPIFLSIGYSTCHWCHVMEREILSKMRKLRVCSTGVSSPIKVDREERPDIDQVYMTVCQATTGAGGWPLSIFMGPDRKPFFAGTYFPKRSRMGMPGLMEIAGKIAELWAGGREQLGRISEEITRAIEPKRSGTACTGYPALSCWRGPGGNWPGLLTLSGADSEAPRNSRTLIISLSLRDGTYRNPGSNAFQMVEKTLLSMRSGGIFDQIGFGFHRYSVDEKWLVPHFEKMLYDQALLALAYTDAFLATGDERYAKVIKEIFEYVTREMQSPEGGFYCAQDADSEGKEGIFFTWTPAQVADILGKDAGDIFCRAYGITPQGNFEEGMSIPHIAKSFETLARDMGMSLPELENILEDGRKKLLDAREKRVHPSKGR